MICATYTNLHSIFCILELAATGASTPAKKEGKDATKGKSSTLISPYTYLISNANVVIIASPATGSTKKGKGLHKGGVARPVPEEMLPELARAITDVRNMKYYIVVTN